MCQETRSRAARKEPMQVDEHVHARVPDARRGLLVVRAAKRDYSVGAVCQPGLPSHLRCELVGGAVRSQARCRRKGIEREESRS